MVKKDELSKYMAIAGSRGGKARLKTMTPEECSEVARKAGRASGKARAAKRKV
jgi:general stress protein YciG